MLLLLWFLLLIPLNSGFSHIHFDIPLKHDMIVTLSVDKKKSYFCLFTNLSCQVNRRFFKVVLPAGDYCCLCLDGVSKPASEVGEQQRNTVSPQSNVSRYDGQIDFVQSMDFMRSDQYYGGNPISPERHLTSEDYDGDADVTCDVTCDVTRATPPGVVTAREANGKLLRSIQRSI